MSGDCLADSKAVILIRVCNVFSIDACMLELYAQRIFHDHACMHLYM